MLNIPSSFILSSKLSPLEPKDVLRLLELAQTRWNDNCVQYCMDNHPNRPLLAAGISNPQDLQRVISYGVPVIHLEHDCQSLQGAQRRHLNDLKYIHFLEFISSAGCWGGLGALISHPRWSRKVTENVPAAMIYGGTTMAIVALSLYTAQFMRKLRYNYKLKMIKDEYFLLRDDVVYSGFWFVTKKIVPYCFTVASIYTLCNHKLG
ncbi:uncharacterized protein BX664DRAFT_338735 [Halteromyces radiatus]|uniref:uncharacterized protein n=1 Tax=Halteromyces radiatus TaxID=101107 RepID=UPI002220CA5F|nr:uncharacterized protein BX664DRAFT_338735 [Halteromyces radiatus]KAI8085177.1 hypothetical protein BX664DRAFT_338735 [Halteromyces radiatus]